MDQPVVFGGVVFGIGWGLAGFCPGPAVVAVGAGAGKAMLFVAAMVAGMALVDAFNRRQRRARTPSSRHP
jgi:uncharacterized membrane protein YedE/YeeE